ncbi:TetR/AcrR family transcriptional regulator [Halocalculus aciditolerans]|nr:TetR/AcrR family transcriptional regulator [Halocalculus aciditolerans]
MTSTPPSAEKWSDAEEEIMQATYQALLSYGYADLSMARIADELDKSKAATYYYYDSKDDLLVALLDYTIDRFERSIDTEFGDDPKADLDHLVEKLLPLREDEKPHRIFTVLVVLRAQAVSNDAFREQFTRLDEKIAATIRDIIQRGVDDGVFRDVDTTRVAEHVFATIAGTRYGRATTDRDVVAETRVSLAAYVDSELVRR